MQIPFDKAAEEALIGSVLLAESVLPELVVDEHLAVEDFYIDQHRSIYRAMIDLYSSGQSIDLVSLAAKLSQTAGSRDHNLPVYSTLVPNVGNVRGYARLVKDQARLRNTLRITNQIQEWVEEKTFPPDQLVDAAQRAILELSKDEFSRELQSMAAITEVEFAKLEMLYNNPGSLTGIGSGFAGLDEYTNGFQPGNLIILAARPSMGKSAMMGNMAEAVAQSQQKPVALFSLEMSESELFQRFLASKARVSAEALRSGRIPASKMDAIADARVDLAELPVFVDTSGDISALDIRTKARRLAQREGGLGMIMVDYLQLMRPVGKSDSRTEQLSQMTRNLKLLAQELEVPVVVLSQLNRGVEMREDKRPMLSDLRESGAIEQDADVVLFIYRQDYYERDREDTGQADLIIAKQRNGRLGTIKLMFDQKLVTFSEALHSGVGV